MLENWEVTITDKEGDEEVFICSDPPVPDSLFTYIYLADGTRKLLPTDEIRGIDYKIYRKKGKYPNV